MGEISRSLLIQVLIVLFKNLILQRTFWVKSTSIVLRLDCTSTAQLTSARHPMESTNLLVVFSPVSLPNPFTTLQSSPPTHPSPPASRPLFRGHYSDIPRALSIRMLPRRGLIRICQCRDLLSGTNLRGDQTLGNSVTIRQLRFGTGALV